MGGRPSQLSFPVISMCVSQQYEYVIAGEIFETILGATPILMDPLVVFLSLVVYLPLVVYLHLVVLLVEVGGLWQKRQFSMLFFSE